jgi:hypothetical protein
MLRVYTRGDNISYAGLEPEDYRGEDEHRAVVGGAFLLAGRHPTPLFESINAALDHIAARIDRLLEDEWMPGPRRSLRTLVASHWNGIRDLSLPQHAATEQQEIALRILLKAEDGGLKAPGRVVNRRQERQSRAPVLQPGMRTPVDLDQLTRLLAALPSAPMLRGPPHEGSSTSDAPSNRWTVARARTIPSRSASRSRRCCWLRAPISRLRQCHDLSGDRLACRKTRQAQDRGGFRRRRLPSHHRIEHQQALLSALIQQNARFYMRTLPLIMYPGHNY